MSYFIERRRWERPDRPQPVYTGAVSLWEAPLYVSIADATRNSYRLPDRIVDRTYVQQTVPAPAWIFTSLPAAATTAQLWPAILQNVGLSYRSDDRARLDVRRYDWFPSSAWTPRVVDGVVATWIPVFDAEPSYRPAARAVLDVRGYEWAPEPAWIFSALPVTTTTAQQWPAVLQNLGLSYRSGERARLDVRQYDWSPSFGWAAKVVDGIVAQWIPVFDAEVSYRVDGRAPLDVRRYDWLPQGSWVSNIPVPTFRPQWAVNSNQLVGPIAPQPETH